MKRKPMRSMNALLITYLVFILLVAGFLTGTAYLIILFLGIFPALMLSHTGPFMIMLMLILFTTMITASLGRTKLRPVDDLVTAMTMVSQGNFNVRVDEAGVPREMTELVASFNDMARELGSIEMFRKDFINNFSHEFKTPIVSIRGFAKQLERDDLTEEQRREYTSIIVSESERLANMASNILLLTKLENQQIVTDKKEYRLDEQLRSCILLLEKQWSSKDIELVLNLDEVTYVGNEEMCSHIWVNLIGNAIKFSPEGAPLEITCAKANGAAVVYITDHGVGMDEVTQKRIFEKFYQGDSARATEGNGLGLSLVRRIVDLCNGDVRVSSKLGVGTTFTVLLP